MIFEYLIPANGYTAEFYKVKIKINEHYKGCVDKDNRYSNEAFVINYFLFTYIFGFSAVNSQDITKTDNQRQKRSDI